MALYGAKCFRVVVILLCVSHTLVSDAMRSALKRMGARVGRIASLLHAIIESSVLMLRAHESHV